MYANPHTETQPYAPPGWMRGITLFILLAVGTVMLITIALVPMIFAGYEMVKTAPYTYPVSGDPVIDKKTLSDTVLTGMVPIAITGFLILPLFLWLHKLLVKHPLRTLIGSKPAFWRDFTLAIVFTSIFWLPAFYYGISTTDRDPMLWIAAAPLAALALFIALPFQVFAEELIFRGYLQQWFTTRFGSVFLATLLQGLLFALMHPGDLAAVFLLAIAASAVTRATHNLGAATAIHLMNNLMVFLLSFSPTADGVILPGFQFATPLPFGMPIGTAILILCLMLLPRLLAQRAFDQSAQKV